MQENNLIKVPTELARVLDRMGLTEYEIVQEDPDGIVISAPVEYCRILIRMGLVGYSQDTGSKFYDLTYTNEDNKITAVFNGANDRVITPGEDVIARNEEVKMHLTAEAGYVIDTVKVNTQTEEINAESFDAIATSKATKDMTVIAIANTAKTLTYSLGAYGTGSVPAAVKAGVDTTIEVSFSPAPTRHLYKFVGWATTDGKTSVEDAEYTADGTHEITMTDNITLYPVFVATDQYITVDNTNNDYDIDIIEEGNGTRTTVLTVAHGTTELFDFTANAKYYFEVKDSAEMTGTLQGLYNGTYNGATYNYEEIDSHLVETARYIPNPETQSDYWDSFRTSDRGTLKLEYHETNNYLRIQPKDHDVAIYEYNNGTYTESHTVNNGASYDYEYTNDKFMLGVKDAHVTNMEAKMTGSYEAQIYTNVNIAFGDNEGAFEYNRFKNPVASATPAGTEADYEWNYNTTGSAKFTVEDVQI